MTIPISELHTIRAALDGYLAESESYERSSRVSDKPSATDLCCPAHQARYEEQVRVHKLLADRVESVEKTIEAVERAIAEHVSWPEEPNTDYSEDDLVHIVTLSGAEYDDVIEKDDEELVAHLSQWDYGDENDGASSVNGYQKADFVEQRAAKRIAHDGTLYWLDRDSMGVTLYRRPVDAGIPQESIVITRAELREWLGYRPDYNEVRRIAEAIKHSTIPEAISTIAENIT